jgi:predicted MFS family arabinose efflux permease
MAVPRRHEFGVYLYHVTLSLGFYVPVNVVYLLDQDFSLAFVGLTWTVFSFSLLAAEIPTGYLGDRIGRRRTLVLGSACRIVGIGGYAFADAAATFLLLKVFTGVGWALRSGTTDAYVYELLGANGSEDAFTRITGRSNAAQLATSALTALAGGGLYAWRPTAPFIASASLAAVGIPVLLALPPVADDAEDPFSLRDATRTIRRQVGRPDVRWLVAYTGLLLVTFALTRTFEQPALQGIGVSPTGLGALYAAFKLASAVGGATVGALHERLGTEPLLVALAPVLAIAYAAILVAPMAFLPLAFTYRLVKQVIVPVRNQYLNDRLADVGRATVLSGVSLLLTLFAGLGRLAGSALVGAFGPIDLIGVVGVALPSTAIVVWLATSPVRDTAPTAT